MNFVKLALEHDKVVARATLIWRILYQASRTWRRTNAYHTRGVENVTFDPEFVVVETSMQDRDTTRIEYYHYPLAWLDLDRAELDAEITRLRGEEEAKLQAWEAERSKVTAQFEECTARLDRIVSVRDGQLVAQNVDRIRVALLKDVIELQGHSPTVDQRLADAEAEIVAGDVTLKNLNAELEVVRQERFALSDKLKATETPPRVSKPGSQGLGPVFLLGVVDGLSPYPDEVDTGGELHGIWSK